jgi:TRAP-type C4-dicarboxylate transport system permease small subunit
MAFIYLAIPCGSGLMCFRFLQVAWAFYRTGELPHHDAAKVEGVVIPDIVPGAPEASAAPATATR